LNFYASLCPIVLNSAKVDLRDLRELGNNLDQTEEKDLRNILVKFLQLRVVTFTSDGYELTLTVGCTKTGTMTKQARICPKCKKRNYLRMVVSCAPRIKRKLYPPPKTKEQDVYTETAFRGKGRKKKGRKSQRGSKADIVMGSCVNTEKCFHCWTELCISASEEKFRQLIPIALFTLSNMSEPETPQGRFCSRLVSPFCFPEHGGEIDDQLLKDLLLCDPFKSSYFPAADGFCLSNVLAVVEGGRDFDPYTFTHQSAWIRYCEVGLQVLQADPAYSNPELVAELKAIICKQNLSFTNDVWTILEDYENELREMEGISNFEVGDLLSGYCKHTQIGHGTLEATSSHVIINQEDTARKGTIVRYIFYRQQGNRVSEITHFVLLGFNEDFWRNVSQEGDASCRLNIKENVFAPQGSHQEPTSIRSKNLLEISSTGKESADVSRDLENVSTEDEDDVIHDDSRLDDHEPGIGMGEELVASTFSRVSLSSSSSKVVTQDPARSESGGDTDDVVNDNEDSSDKPERLLSAQEQASRSDVIAKNSRESDLREVSAPKRRVASVDHSLQCAPPETLAFDRPSPRRFSSPSTGDDSNQHSPRRQVEYPSVAPPRNMDIDLSSPGSFSPPSSDDESIQDSPKRHPAVAPPEHMDIDLPSPGSLPPPISDDESIQDSPKRHPAVAPPEHMDIDLPSPRSLPPPSSDDESIQDSPKRHAAVAPTNLPPPSSDDESTQDSPKRHAAVAPTNLPPPSSDDESIQDSPKRHAAVAPTNQDAGRKRLALELNLSSPERPAKILKSFVSTVPRSRSKVQTTKSRGLRPETPSRKSTRIATMQRRKLEAEEEAKNANNQGSEEKNEEEKIESSSTRKGRGLGKGGSFRGVQIKSPFCSQISDEQELEVDMSSKDPSVYGDPQTSGCAVHFCSFWIDLPGTEKVNYWNVHKACQKAASALNISIYLTWSRNSREMKSCLKRTTELHQFSRLLLFGHGTFSDELCTKMTRGIISTQMTRNEEGIETTNTAKIDEICAYVSKLNPNFTRAGFVFCDTRSKSSVYCSRSCLRLCK
jgi:hypothetical protein